MAQKTQILSGHGLQQAQAPETIRQRMEHLHRNAFIIIVDTEQVTIVPSQMHGHAGIHNIGMHKGTGSVIGFQIAPKQPRTHSDLVCGEARQRHIQSLLQNIRPDFFRQSNGHAVYIGEGAALQGGIYHPRQIQPIPSIAVFFLIMSSHHVFIIHDKADLINNLTVFLMRKAGIG